jgi:NADH-ubiquinone oxidoreductase chain 4
MYSGCFLFAVLYSVGISPFVGCCFIYSWFIGLIICIFIVWYCFGLKNVLCLCVLAILFRIPIFFVHLSLPRAHVKAPVSGSKILAGVLFKLGGYGLLHIFPIWSKYVFGFIAVWVVLRLVGGLFVSLFHTKQTDLKSTTAYSSVAHISLITGGIITQGYWGVCRSFALMVADGLCSSGLFCLLCYIGCF